MNNLKVGITGAEGTIGGVLRKGLSKHNEIRSFTFEAVDFESVKVDLSKSEEVIGRRQVVFGTNAWDGRKQENVTTTTKDADKASFTTKPQGSNFDGQTKQDALCNSFIKFIPDLFPRKIIFQ